MRRVPKAAWIAVLLAGSLALLALSGCGSSSGDDTDFTGSGHPNVDTANTRYVSGPISTKSVSTLKEAWRHPITGRSTFGSYASAPIVANGVIYSQDLASNVEALDLESGEVLWTKSYESPSHGPNGLVVADGLVFGATATGAFALDQETGEEVWEVTLARNPSEGVDMAPGYQDGLVYVSTVPVNATSFYEGNGVGILWALDGKTGKRVWKFNTVPKSLWGNTKVNSGGGLWYPPAFDDEGSMYVGTGNPGPIPGTKKYPWGSSRADANLYTDSLIKLDAKTGEMQWYYQQTPHDVNDWDFQNPPILAKAPGKPPLVIGSGKSGFVVALNRNNSRVVWKRSVGIHNGNDKIGLETMKGEFPDTPITIYPGSLGGVIAPMATDGKTLFVPVVNSPLVINGQEEKEEPGPSTGELVALDVATGAVKWKHKFSLPAFGFTTAVNDLVFATTSDGTVSAFDTKTGRIVWQEVLPAGTNSGVAVSGDTVVAPAGLAAAANQTPQIVAYRLGG